MLPTATRWIAAIALLTGCGGVGGSLSGTIDGTDFAPVDGYWGGPFVVFSNQAIDCIDLWWVAKDYDEDEQPWDQGFDILQITFNESAVVEGTFDVSGVSPVSAARLTGGDDDFVINDASSGLLTIDSVKAGGKVKGDLDISLAGGTLSGSFAVGDCVNLTSAY